jgi:thymidylate synthase (FAD)
MRLIKPSFEILEQKPGLDGLLQHIERCGRTCYKSEDKITEESAPKFVDMLVKRGHTAMVEHGTVYLKYSITLEGSMNMANKYHFNKYSTVTIGNEPLCGGEPQEYKDKFNGHTYAYITTNYRVLLQNDWLDDLKYQCEPTEHHVKRITVKFTCDRGVSHEFVRHRVFSFAQESTRYCNYSKDKFGKECTFIIPCWLGLPEGSVSSPEIPIFRERHGNVVGIFLNNLYWAEANYFDLLEQGWIAQQARAVLPNSLKTELIMTGTIEQWEGFFKLRCAKDAHPQARELAVPLYEEFVKRGYITARISK